MELYIPPSSNGRACETWKNDIPKVPKCTNNLSFPVIFHIKNKNDIPKVQKCTDNLSFPVIFHIKNLIINPYIKKKDPNRKKLE